MFRFIVYTSYYSTFLDTIVSYFFEVVSKPSPSERVWVRSCSIKTKKISSLRPSILKPIVAMKTEP